MSRLRGHTLRSRLIRTLVALGVVSVVLLAAVNYVVVRGVLGENSRSQLTALREVRADAVELAIDRLLVRTSSYGIDPAVAEALLELDAAYETLEREVADDPLTSEQLAEVEAVYEPVVGRFDDAGVDRPAVSDLLPASPAGRYLQYHYIAQNTEEQRADLRDAGDGSEYSEVHARHHAYLTEVADQIGATDLLFVGARTFDVVYSVNKFVDLGTDVASGPYSLQGLGVSVGKLAAVGIDDAAIADLAFHLPNSDEPVIHAATPVRSGLEVVGALVVSLPADAITQLVTSGQNWDLLGLGDTGDAYVVGRDGLLRTIPRGYYEDPAGYVERLADRSDDGERVAGLVEFTGSPVLIQSVDNAVVRDAIDGEVTTDSVTNGVGTETVASAGPLDVGGLGWVIVTEQAESEAGDELSSFLWSILIVLAVLLGVLVLVSGAVAQRIARPVKPLVRTARSIADGDAHVEIPDLGRNELGDVSKQLGLVADRLVEQERSIEAEEQRIEQMLENALPPSLVERVRRGERDLAEVVDSATVIAVVERGVPASSSAEQDALIELTSQMTAVMSALAAEHGVERVKITLERQLYVAGRGTASAGADQALAFARAALDRIPEIAAEQGLDVDARIGLSSGLVASGVLGSRQVSFDVWGTPVSAAVESAERAESGQLLVDDEVLTALDADVETVDVADGLHRVVLRDSAPSGPAS